MLTVVGAKAMKKKSMTSGDWFIGFIFWLMSLCLALVPLALG